MKELKDVDESVIGFMVDYFESQDTWISLRILSKKFSALYNRRGIDLRDHLKSLSIGENPPLYRKISPNGAEFYIPCVVLDSLEDAHMVKLEAEIEGKVR